MREPYPILLEDGSSLDWDIARYSTELKVGDGYAAVTHTLEGAPQLQSLIEQGTAKWVLELRCPTTLLSRWEHSETAACIAKWDAAEVQGELYFMPGLITTKPITLTNEGLSDLWSLPIQVPRGCWLARGDIRRAKSLAASLLTFFSRPDFREGEMAVEPDLSGGDLHFNVYVSEQLLPQCLVRRDLQVAALIAAFGRIPHLEADAGQETAEDAAEYGILGTIKERLLESNVPVWGSEDNQYFDPARAATAIEQFFVDQVESNPS